MSHDALGFFAVAGGSCAGGFLGAADEAAQGPHLSRPKLVPRGRAPELGWPWRLCTVAVKGALSRGLVASARELHHAVTTGGPKGSAWCPLEPQRPRPALFLILTSLGTPGSI